MIQPMAKDQPIPMRNHIKRIGARDARNQFADLLGQVHYGRETIIIERAGKPMAALVSLALMDKLLALWDNDFSIIDRMRADAPQVSPAEVEQDVDEAIAAVRATSSATSPATAGPR